MQRPAFSDTYWNQQSFFIIIKALENFVQIKFYSTETSPILSILSVFIDKGTHKSETLLASCTSVNRTFAWSSPSVIPNASRFTAIMKLPSKKPWNVVEPDVKGFQSRLVVSIYAW